MAAARSNRARHLLKLNPLLVTLLRQFARDDYVPLADVFPWFQVSEADGERF
jgi:hypothetical protein